MLSMKHAGVHYTDDNVDVTVRSDFFATHRSGTLHHCPGVTLSITLAALPQTTLQVPKIGRSSAQRREVL